MGNIKFIEPLCRHGYMVSNCIYCEEMAALRARVEVLEDAIREAENALLDYIPTIEKTGASLNYGHAVLRKLRAALDAAKEGK